MGKRSHNEGSNHKVIRKGKVYFVHEISYTVPDTNIVKRKQFSSLVSYKAAIEKATAFKAELASDLLSDAKSITFGEWAEIWLKDYKKGSVRIKTFDRCKYSLKYAIIEFGNVLLSRLKAVDLQQFLNKLTVSGGTNEKGLSEATVKGIRVVLKDCLNKAVEVGYLEKNIANATSSIKGKQKEIVFLNDDEINQLLNEADKDEDKRTPMIIYLALTTGMRLGEIFALTWDKIDFSKKMLYITKHLVNSSKGLHYEDPKTQKSKRQITLPDLIITKLKFYRKWQEWQKTLKGDNWIDKNLVFHNCNGGEFSPANFRRRHFKPLCQRLGISDDFTFHCQRHTHASILLKKGENIKVIQERLGHSSVTLTLNTYSHLAESMQEHAAQSVNEFFKKVTLEN